MTVLTAMLGLVLMVTGLWLLVADTRDHAKEDADAFLRGYSGPPMRASYWGSAVVLSAGLVTLILTLIIAFV